MDLRQESSLMNHRCQSQLQAGQHEMQFCLFDLQFQPSFTLLVALSLPYLIGLLAPSLEGYIVSRATRVFTYSNEMVLGAYGAIVESLVDAIGLNDSSGSFTSISSKWFFRFCLKSRFSLYVACPRYNTFY